MKKKILSINLIMIIIAGLFVLTGCNGLKEKDRRNDFLKNLVDVSYVKVDGHNVNKKLDAKLAEQLNKIDDSAIDSKQFQNNSKGETGEQAYVFKLYSKDDNILYWLQYYSTSDKITIRSCTGTDKNVEFKDYHTIDDENVIKYIRSVVK